MASFQRAGKRLINLDHVHSIHLAQGTADNSPITSITIDYIDGGHIVITDPDEIAAIMKACKVPVKE